MFGTRVNNKKTPWYIDTHSQILKTELVWFSATNSTVWLISAVYYAYDFEFGREIKISKWHWVRSKEKFETTVE